MEPKWTQQVHFFCVYKSSEFIVKNRVGEDPIHLKPGQKTYFLFFCKKTVFSQPSVSPRREAHFSGLRTCFFNMLEVFLEVFFRDAILG